jgi:[protein-PII] uridylyltransferase
VVDDRLLPIASPEDVRAFARRVPVTLDEAAFSELVLGFPRRYLETTPGVEVLRHYALINGLGARVVISSLARDGAGYRLCVVARDRRFLFARIAGALSCFGLDITCAEAFANANAVVLDTFSCADPSGRLETQDERRSFQAFLENVIAGQTPLAPLLRERIPDFSTRIEGLELAVDDEAHPTATRLRVTARDRIGLLYLLSHTLSALGCNIEMAYVTTAGGMAADDFFVTKGGRKLDDDARDAVRTALLHRRDAADAA